MNNEEINKTIHEARKGEDGKRLCWHEWECIAEDLYGCKNCHISCCWDATYKCLPNPDYSDINSPEYLKALNEFKKEDWWEDFILELRRQDANELIKQGSTQQELACFYLPQHINTKILDPATGAPIIAEYLRGRG